MPLELEQPSAEIQQDRRLTLLRYVKGGEKHNLYVDEFFGMPLRYVVEKGGAKSIVSTSRSRLIPCRIMTSNCRSWLEIHLYSFSSRIFDGSHGIQEKEGKLEDMIPMIADQHKMLRSHINALDLS